MIHRKLRHICRIDVKVVLFGWVSTLVANLFCAAINEGVIHDPHMIGGVLGGRQTIHCPGRDSPIGKEVEGRRPA